MHPHVKINGYLFFFKDLFQVFLIIKLYWENKINNFEFKEEIKIFIISYPTYVLNKFNGSRPP